MVRLRNKPVGTPGRQQRPLSQWHDATPPPLDERLIPGTPLPAEATAAERQPEILCGCCHQVIEDPGVGRTTQCAHCGRKLSTPTHVSTRCQRCGHRHRIRFSELATERVCANCGWTLAIGTIVLMPRHRRRHTVRHVHHGHAGAHADAAWAVLIIGLTLVIAVLALTVL